MTSGRYPVKKTGSTDNERLQINKALDRILDTISRADQWDEAVSWGDHAAENYATALTELEQFADFGIPGKPTLNKTRETLPSGTEVHAITATWSRAGDDSIVYDLEIREADPSISIDQNDVNDILAKSDLYAVPIISNDNQDALITYKAFFDANTRYFFRVRIRRNSLVSNWSAFENIVTTRDQDTPPSPSSLTATPIADGVRLNWNYDYDSNPNVAKIEILRNGIVIDTVPRPALSYIDEPLTVQALYTYTARAVSFFGIRSALSNAAAAVPNRATVTIRASAAPTVRPDGSPLQDGDRWVDSANGDKPYVRVGNSWVPEYTEIDGDDVLPNSMDADRITARTISADRIETGAITANEIATRTITADKITTGTITANEIATNTLTANEINTSTINISSLTDDIDVATENSVNVTIRSTSAPSLRPNGSSLQIGDIWINTALNQGDRPSTWNGSTWVPAYTSIDGGTITTGVIKSGNYNPGTTGWIVGVDNGAAEFGNLVARGTISSSNYSSGSAGWQVNVLGNAEFNDITARGSLVTGLANAERVEITPSSPSTDRDYRIWVGANAKNQDNGRFWVDVNGNAKFGGRVRAAQLEGSVMDAVPINVNGAVTSANTTSYVTIANTFGEVSPQIARPVRPFIMVSVPVFGVGSPGAFLVAEVQVETSPGNFSGWQTISQELSSNTTGFGNAVTLAGGLSTFGTGKFRFRVRIRRLAGVSYTGSPQANRYTGLFIGLPAGNGLTYTREDPGVPYTAPGNISADSSVLVPPDFLNGWDIP